MDKDFTKRKNLQEGTHLRVGFIIVAVVILISVSIFVEINIRKINNILLPKLVELGIGDILTRVYYMTMVRTWVLIVLVGVLAIYLPLYLSGRLLGSRYRIEREILEHVSTGNLMHKFKIREKDEMASTVNALNTMLENLRVRVQDVEDFRKDVEKNINDCLDLMKGELKEENKKQIINKLDTLSKKNREIPYLV